MRYQIIDTTVSIGGEVVLDHIDFEIRGSQKVAIAGKNGAGKTTLLKLIYGDLEPDRDDKRAGAGIVCSRNLTKGMLCQNAIADPSQTVEEYLLSSFYRTRRHKEDIREEDIREEDIREEDICEEDIREEDICEEDIREEDIREADIREEDIREEGIHGEGICGKDPHGKDLHGENASEAARTSAGNVSKAVCMPAEEGGIPPSDLQDYYAYRTEFYKIFTGFGFGLVSSRKRIREFSGGEQTKLGFIRLLLEKPDILLLDEPTNYLDLNAAEWLEGYLKTYEKAVVMVSHDRFFLDQTAQVVYELDRGHLTRYTGNYTAFRQQKQKDLALAKKAWERYQAQVKKEQELIERFKHKPSKAAFTRSRRTKLRHMEEVPKPLPDSAHIFTEDIVPRIPGSRRVYACEKLVLGYDKDRPLLTLDLQLQRGSKTALLGPNGAGKSTFLKTLTGQVRPLSGRQSLGSLVEIGYFDQMSARMEETCSVLEHFCKRFPALGEKMARQILAEYLFTGRTVGRRVCDLSGGEKSRLVLCELLTQRPNFLVLDEPTSHMDIYARETLESALLAYRGTILFVSHDRYFTEKIADELVIFEQGKAVFYPFSYGEYMDRKRTAADAQGLRAQIDAKDAALLQSMRDVPAPVRDRSASRAEETYEEWLLAQAAEEMEQAASAARQAVESYRNIFLEISPAEAKDEGEAIRSAAACLQEALQRWNDACLQWYDIYQETEYGRRPFHAQ